MFSLVVNVFLVIYRSSLTLVPHKRRSQQRFFFTCRAESPKPSLAFTSVIKSINHDHQRYTSHLKLFAEGYNGVAHCAAGAAVAASSANAAVGARSLVEAATQTPPPVRALAVKIVVFEFQYFIKIDLEHLVCRLHLQEPVVVYFVTHHKAASLVACHSGLPSSRVPLTLSTVEDARHHLRIILNVSVTSSLVSSKNGRHFILKLHSDDDFLHRDFLLVLPYGR